MNDEQRTMNEREGKSLFLFRHWPVYKAAKAFRGKMRALVSSYLMMKGIYWEIRLRSRCIINLVDLFPSFE